MKRIPFHAKHNCVRCFPHIIHLANTAVVDAANAVQLALSYAENNWETAMIEKLGVGFIMHCQVLVCKVRVSSTRQAKFKALVLAAFNGILQLLRDVSNRWCYTLLMLIRLKELREPLEKFVDAHINDKDIKGLIEPEWRAIDDIIEVLMVGHAFQQRLSYSKTPTLCDYLPGFTEVIARWEELKIDLPRLDNTGVIDAGIKKLRKYQEKAASVPVYILAMIINPKMKLQWLAEQQIKNPTPGHDYVEEAQELFFKALEVLVSSWYGISSILISAQKIPLPSMMELQADSSTNPTNPFKPAEEAWIAKSLKGKSAQQRGQVSAPDEGKSYLADMYLNSEMDSLGFWQNVQRWPWVFRLAMDILPVQGSSVPSKRVFSSAKLTKTNLRNQLSPWMMEACMIIKGSYQTEGPLDFTSHFKHQPMLEELKLMTTKEDEMLLEEDVSIQDYISMFQPLPAEPTSASEHEVPP
ncbi:hypothetical protein PM082_014570 [Marasmius tenuissimus]|nr:hypothetical protein PM082_014570 [Marasmius tenuissimus]